jgi:curved DNA-binding protein CbpA
VLSAALRAGDSERGMASFEEIDEARRLLELGEVSTLKEIKTVYRRKASRYHPDKCASGTISESEEMMKRLNQAYKLLQDFCNNYRYTFREEDVARTYADEESLKNYYDKWFDSI